jgi:hypothetical protein
VGSAPSPHVVNLPISKDTIMIKDKNNEKTRVGKLLLQISIRELHNDLLSDGPLGLPDAKRRLEKETNNCVNQRAKAIRKRRSDNYREEVYPNLTHRHPKPRKGALTAIQCPNVEGFDFPKMTCILRACLLCPKYSLLREELLLTQTDTPIDFHFYHKYSKCRIRGILDDGVKSCKLCDVHRTLVNKKPGKFSQQKHLT